MPPERPPKVIQNCTKKGSKKGPHFELLLDSFWGQFWGPNRCPPGGTFFTSASLGSSWPHLGFILASLGSSWPLLASPGIILAPFWLHLDLSWPLYSPSWPHLGINLGLLLATFVSMLASLGLLLAPAVLETLYQHDDSYLSPSIHQSSASGQGKGVHK